MQYCFISTVVQHLYNENLQKKNGHQHLQLKYKVSAEFWAFNVGSLKEGTFGADTYKKQQQWLIYNIIMHKQKVLPHRAADKSLYIELYKF